MGLLAREEPRWPAQHAVKPEAAAPATTLPNGASTQAPASEAPLGPAEGAAFPAPQSKRVLGAEAVPEFSQEVKQQLQAFWDGLRGTCQALRAVERYRVAAIAFRR